MSGFAGFIASDKKGANLKAKVSALVGAVTHRGPDDREFHMEQENGLVLGVQHKAGTMPAISKNKRYILLCDGQVYNQAALLPVIEALGFEKALEKFSGAFALMLYDTKEQEIYLARDRLGQKPLYYGSGPDGFYIGSELKAIHAAQPAKPAVNRDVAALYLRWGYVPDPYCIFEGFHKLLPGSFVRIDLKDLKPAPPQRFWSLQNTIEKREAFTGTQDEALDILQARLIEAVEKAAPQTGILLSGSAESSLITAIMQKFSEAPVKTFTAMFEGGDDKAALQAGAVAAQLGADHSEVLITQDIALETVAHLPNLFDEPFGDPSAIIAFHLHRYARDHMAVALCAAGGAENFGGHEWYETARRVEGLPDWLRYGAVPFLNMSPSRRKLGSVLAAQGPRELYTRLHSNLQNPRDPLLTYAPKPLGAPLDEIDFDGRGSTQERLMAYDSAMFLPGNLLMKLDRTSTASGLELRNPLLDQALVEWVWSLPPALRTDRRVLKDLLARYMPQALDHRPVQSFKIPCSDWLRGPLMRWAEDLFIEDFTGLLDMQSVQKIWQAHKTGQADYGPMLWVLVQFQAWAKRWA